MRTFFRCIAVAGAALLTSSGCYKLVPLTSDTPSPETQVVLEFTDVGAERLGGLLGSAIISARGLPVLWSTDTIALSMVSTTRRSGEEQFWNGERIAIPREAVARVHERRLDRGRSTLLAATGAVIAVGTWAVVKGSSGGTPRPPVLPPID